MLKLGTVILSFLSICAIAQPSMATNISTSTTAKSAGDNLHAQVIINFPTTRSGWRGNWQRERQRQRWEAIRRQRRWEGEVRNRYPYGYNRTNRDDRYRKW